MRLSIPRNLKQAAATDAARQAWVARLPSILAQVQDRWDVELEPPYQPGGRVAWVAPARSATLGAVVLKLAWRHDESQHEADGLDAWGGTGAVHLYEATEVDGDTSALLLEPCTPGTTLTHRPEPEQDQVVARLLGRLWIHPPEGHVFRPLESMCDAWVEEFERKLSVRNTSIDAGLVRDGTTLFRALARSADDNTLLCTDLHAGNVLAAHREPWLMIDPKPYVGDRTYDALQHMLNCEERLQHDPVGLVHRLATMCALDAERLRLWLFARCVLASLDSPHLVEVARRIAPN